MKARQALPRILEINDLIKALLANHRTVQRYGCHHLNPPINLRITKSETDVAWLLVL